MATISVTRFRFAVSASPFAGASNLTTLVFSIDNGSPSIDETGNFTAPQASLTVIALLNPANRTPYDRSVPGEILNQTYLKGVMVDPMQPPSGLLPGHKAQTTFGGRVGTFTLALSTEDAFGISQQLGYPIEGTFTVTGNRGN